ncbi:hypothetical protein ScalyP_jg154, partial [Parmales sp. scaly parma]
MRIARHDLITQLTHQDLPTATTLTLNSQRIESLSTSLSLCTSLTTLSLRSNNLRSIVDTDLLGCVRLYDLDLAHNRLSDLGGLSPFPVFGSLNLEGNDLGYEALGALRAAHVVCLTVRNNKGMEGSGGGG